MTYLPWVLCSLSLKRKIIVISITEAHLVSCLVPSLDLISTTQVMATACLSTAVRGITLTVPENNEHKVYLDYLGKSNENTPFIRFQHQINKRYIKCFNFWELHHLMKIVVQNSALNIKNALVSLNKKN